MSTTSHAQIKIIETPRDGMQGVEQFIPTHKKIEFINLLLQCGFDTVEVGSFVSPRAIPQMKDTAEVLENLDLSKTNSDIAVLVVNEKGGEKAVRYDFVDQLFFPFSVSPTFIQRNLNTTVEEAEKTVDKLQNICVRSGKTLVTYLSMGFGDPYGDEWNMELMYQGVERLVAKGISVIPLSDIMGDVTPERIKEVFTYLKNGFPEVEFGLHIHTLAGQEYKKIDAAWQAGIRRFDTVINGLGGCPMAGKELVSNLPLSGLTTFCRDKNIPTGLNEEMVERAKSYPLLS
jgi:hydroxymethylglutaryl-CoA lyase